MNRLRLLRFERGLEMAEVASKTGITRQTLSRIESGETAHPSASTAKALADFYEISVAELLGVDKAEAV